MGKGLSIFQLLIFKDYFSVKTDGLAELKEDFINAKLFARRG
jgi:hypothetical protein